MANLTPEDLEFIAMLEAKAKASKQNAFMEKAKIARERRNSRLEAEANQKNKLNLIEQKIVDQEATIVNQPQPITNQKIEDKNINQEVTIVNESQSITNQEIEPNNDLDIQSKEDYKIWISIILQSSFYADKEGNIPHSWQHLAKEYYQIQFTNNDPETQDLIDKAIALLDDEDKTLLNQIISLNNQDCTQKDILEAEEYLADPEIEQEYDQDDTEDNLVSNNNLLDTQDNQNYSDNDVLGNNQTTLKTESINDTQVNNNQLLTNHNYSQNNHQEDTKTAELNNNPLKPDDLTDTANQVNCNGLTDTANQVNSESLPIKSDNNQIKYKLIENNEALENEIALLTNEDILAIDTETTGLDPNLNKIRLIQIASYNHPTIIIDCFKCDARLIQPLLVNSSIKVFHNAKFDLKFFFALGLEVNQSIFDTMLAHQLVNLGKDNVKAKLKAIASEYLQMELNKDEQVSDWQSDNLSDNQLEYAVKDAEVLLPLREKLREEIIKHELTRVAKIEFDCVVAVAMMEFNGMLLDVGKWQEILREAVKRKEELTRQLQQLLPSEANTLFQLDINLDSSKQLLEALRRAGINCQNTNSKTLKKLLPQFPEILNPLLEYKKVSKLISSFGDSLLKKINIVTGRLHGSYIQLGSQAGRFTAKDPNLQQIPRNQETRSCFTAQPSYKLVIADYSQIELRIASELTRDKTMIEAYNRGEDLHKLTASIVLNKPLDEVTKSDRQIAKSANFGLIYGSSVNGFRGYAESNYGISLSEKEAQKIMDNFFKSYQGLAKWHKQTKSRIYNQGIDETRTLSGRIRHFDKPTPQQVLNTPVQGLGADLIKLALGKLVTALKGYDCRILATVHDEIILEAHESIADEVAKILSEVMVSSGKEFLKLVPVEAQASIGDNWSDK